jgi:hypothetical protein
VAAPDREAAIEAAIDEFGVPLAERRRIIVQQTGAR